MHHTIEDQADAIIEARIAERLLRDKIADLKIELSRLNKHHEKALKRVEVLMGE